MERARPLIVKILAFAAAMAAIIEAPALPTGTELAGVAPEVVSRVAATLIEESIPREYARSKDWGRTKRITTGVRSSGNFFDFDFHRKKTDVKHGVWKSYRLTLIEPDKNLAVRIDNLRSIGSGRYALTLYVTAKVHGWARVKVYDRGVHIIAVEAEGDTSIRLSLDAEIRIETVSTGSFVPGLAVNPVVTDARLAFDDFRLSRVSDVRGTLAHELGDLLRHAMEDELRGPTLVAKLNHSIDKRRDRLRLTPDMLLGKTAPTGTATAGRASNVTSTP